MDAPVADVLARYAADYPVSVAPKKQA